MKYKTSISQQEAQILANQIGHVLVCYAQDSEPVNGKTKNVFETVGLYFDNKNVEIHCEDGYLPPNDFDMGIFSVIDWEQKEIPSGFENGKLIKIPVGQKLTKIEVLQEHVVTTKNPPLKEWELDHIAGFILYFDNNKFIVTKSSSWSDFLSTSFGDLNLTIPPNNEWEDEEDNGIKYHYEVQLKQVDIADFLKN